MDLKGKVALFQLHKTTVDITDVATREVVQQFDVQGKIGRSASVQKNIAAISVYQPEPGVHVMDLVKGHVSYKFILPYGDSARVTLSKDTLTIGVGNRTGVSC